LTKWLLITPQGKNNQVQEASSAQNAVKALGNTVPDIGNYVIVPADGMPHYISLETYRTFHAIIPGQGGRNADLMIDLIATMIKDYINYQSRIDLK
jgi:hypothetical protein